LERLGSREAFGVRPAGRGGRLVTGIARATHACRLPAALPCCAALIALLEQKVPALAHLCRRFHVKRLYLFGSRAREDFRADSSDLDFLVAFEESSPADYTENYFGLPMNWNGCLAGAWI
jgi:hypothetical protein